MKLPPWQAAYCPSKDSHISGTCECHVKRRVPLQKGRRMLKWRIVLTDSKFGYMCHERKITDKREVQSGHTDHRHLTTNPGATRSWKRLVMDSLQKGGLKLAPRLRPSESNFELLCPKLWSNNFLFFQATKFVIIGYISHSELNLAYSKKMPQHFDNKEHTPVWFFFPLETSFW